MYVIDPLKCYLIGAAAIVVTVVAHSKKKKRLTSWIHASGAVQNVRRGDGDAMVTVRFSDQAGQLRTASVKVADDDGVSLGGELEISYNPANPEQAFVRSAKDMNLSLYIPVGAGAVLLCLGLFSQLFLPH